MPYRHPSVTNGNHNTHNFPNPFTHKTLLHPSASGQQNQNPPKGFYFSPKGQSWHPHEGRGQPAEKDGAPPKSTQGCPSRSPASDSRSAGGPQSRDTEPLSKNRAERVTTLGIKDNSLLRALLAAAVRSGEHGVPHHQTLPPRYSSAATAFPQHSHLLPAGRGGAGGRPMAGRRGGATAGHLPPEGMRGVRVGSAPQ